MDTTTFGRIAAQSAKQVIIQKMKDAEQDAVYADLSTEKAKSSTVSFSDSIEAISLLIWDRPKDLPAREQVPKEGYRRGDRVRAIYSGCLT